MADSAELVELSGKEILCRYLIGIKRQLSVDGAAREIVLKHNTPSESFSELAEFLSFQIQPGTGNIFEIALKQILEELEELQKSKTNLVLVDTKTGESLFAITPDMIYTPPDYVGEDGLVHKAKPILHPRISSALGLAAQEKEKNINLLKKAADPKARLAYLHIIDPDSIIAMASERLAQAGVYVASDISGIESQQIEFGREQASGIEQSPNIRFHRANLFAAVLTTKIFRECGKNGVCSIGKLEMKKNSKFRWYTVPVKMLSST